MSKMIPVWQSVCQVWALTIAFTTLCSLDAQAVDCVDLISTFKNNAHIDQVKLVKTELVTQEQGAFENRTIVLTFEATLSGGVGDKVTGIEIQSTQSSLTNLLNPSEYFFQANAESPDTVRTLALVRLKPVRFKFEFDLGQRLLTQKGKPWPPARAKDKNQKVLHFNFDAGMWHGFNHWHLYRLDLADPDSVQFDFLKTYSLTQGEIVE